MPHLNPHHPDWIPGYTGDTSLGNVGTGREFGADLYQLYRAGRLMLPEVAGLYADLTTEVHRVSGAARHLFEVDGYVEPAHSLLMHLRGDLQDALRVTSVNIGETGRALVEIAAQFVATDQEAAEAFTKLLEGDREEYRASPSLPVPDPPRREDAPPMRQHDDGHLR